MGNTRDPETGLCRRGSTNRNSRGSAADRRRRRQWLIVTYRANVDAVVIPVQKVYDNDPGVRVIGKTGLGNGVPACRCYRCGDLLVEDTVTADRIKPGVQGGTYRRENIRPACGDCNSETGGPLASKPKSRRVTTTKVEIEQRVEILAVSKQA